jgi:hypothetical protein
MLQTIKLGLPLSFYKKLSKRAVMIDSKNKHITLGEKKAYDPEMIYVRVI